MKIATGNRLNEFWEELKGVLVPKSKVLKTLEEIEANTNEENIAGATALKEVNYKLMFPDGTEFYLDEHEGERGYNSDPARGADTFHPFKLKPTIKTYNCTYTGSNGASTAVIDKGRTLEKDMFLLAAGQHNEGVVAYQVASSTNFGMWVDTYNPDTGEIVIWTGMSSIYYSKIHILYLD